jgi:hypothetical protein
VGYIVWSDMPPDQNQKTHLIAWYQKFMPAPQIHSHINSASHVEVVSRAPNFGVWVTRMYLRYRVVACYFANYTCLVTKNVSNHQCIVSDVFGSF